MAVLYVSPSDISYFSGNNFSFHFFIYRIQDSTFYRITIDDGKMLTEDKTSFAVKVLMLTSEVLESEF